MCSRDKPRLFRSLSLLRIQSSSSFAESHPTHSLMRWSGTYRKPAKPYWANGAICSGSDAGAPPLGGAAWRGCDAGGTGFRAAGEAASADAVESRGGTGVLGSAAMMVTEGMDEAEGKWALLDGCAAAAGDGAAGTAAGLPATGVTAAAGQAVIWF